MKRITQLAREVRYTVSELRVPIAAFAAALFLGWLVRWWIGDRGNYGVRPSGSTQYVKSASDS